LRVDGTNYALQVDNSDEFNGYKNLISAFMPFYQFDLLRGLKLNQKTVGSILPN